MMKKIVFPNFLTKKFILTKKNFLFFIGFFRKKFCKINFLKLQTKSGQRNILGSPSRKILSNSDAPKIASS